MDIQPTLKQRVYLDFLNAFLIAEEIIMLMRDAHFFGRIFQHPSEAGISV